MNSNNFLDDVYTVGENNHENHDDSSGNDSDRDQRRGRQDFYDTISDPSSLRDAIDPISEQDQFRNSSGLMQTPAAPLFPVRGTTSTPGTVPYDAQASRLDQATSVKSRPMQTTTPATTVDKFLAISTVFLSKVPAISLEEIKFKGSQQLLHFSRLPDNLHLPKDPQNVIEYKEWITLAEAFLNATGSTLAIFKAKKWSWEIKMTPSILAAYLKRTGIPNDAILTGHDLQLMHHNCIYENLDLSSRNYNIWQSVVNLFSFLVKAAERVPVLYQTIQQIELNNVTAVPQD